MISISDSDATNIAKWLSDYTGLLRAIPDMRKSLRKVNAARLAGITAVKLQKKLNANKNFKN